MIFYVTISKVESELEVFTVQVTEGADRHRYSFLGGDFSEAQRRKHGSYSHIIADMGSISRNKDSGLKVSVLIRLNSFLFPVFLPSKETLYPKDSQHLLSSLSVLSSWFHVVPSFHLSVFSLFSIKYKRITMWNQITTKMNLIQKSEASFWYSLVKALNQSSASLR